MSLCGSILVILNNPCEKNTNVSFQFAISALRHIYNKLSSSLETRMIEGIKSNLIDSMYGAVDAGTNIFAWLYNLIAEWKLKSQETAMEGENAVLVDLR